MIFWSGTAEQLVVPYTHPFPLQIEWFFEWTGFIDEKAH